MMERVLGPIPMKLMQKTKYVDFKLDVRFFTIFLPPEHIQCRQNLKRCF